MQTMQTMQEMQAMQVMQLNNLAKGKDYEKSGGNAVKGCD